MIQVVPSILCHYAPAANVILYSWPREKRREAAITCNASTLVRAKVNILKAVKKASMS